MNCRMTKEIIMIISLLRYIHVISCFYWRRKSPSQGAVQIKYVCIIIIIIINQHVIS